MHRLGFMPRRAPGARNSLRHDGDSVKSVYSHLAASEDTTEDEFTLSQGGRSRKGPLSWDRRLGYMPMWHVLNSAGIGRFPQYQFDMVAWA